MKITLLGTGTSQGVPVIGCDCPVCTSQDPRDDRLRVSALVQTRGRTLVIDTGPDFRQQMLRNRVRTLDAVLYTHQHKDHVAGLDDIRPFNFRQRQAMPIYLDQYTLEQVKQEFNYIFKDQKYPGIPMIDIHLVEQGPVTVQQIPIQVLEVMHGKLPIRAYRIADFAYVTDTNYIPEAAMAQLQNLEVLVLDALRHEKHYSHFTLEESLKVVEQLQPRQTYLTHISHFLGRHAEIDASLPPGVNLAYDQLSFQVPDPALNLSDAEAEKPSVTPQEP